MLSGLSYVIAKSLCMFRCKLPIIRIITSMISMDGYGIRTRGRETPEREDARLARVAAEVAV